MSSEAKAYAKEFIHAWVGQEETLVNTTAFGLGKRASIVAYRCCNVLLEGLDVENRIDWILEIVPSKLAADTLSEAVRGSAQL